MATHLLKEDGDDLLQETNDFILLQQLLADQSVAGTTGSVSGGLSLRTNKALAGTMGALTGALTTVLLPLYRKLDAARRASSANISLPFRFSLPPPWLTTSTKNDRAQVGLMYRGYLTGTQYLQDVAGTMGSLVGSLTRRTNKSLSGVMGSLSGSLARITNKALAGTAGSVSGAVSKSTSKFFSGTVGTLSGTVNFGYFVSLTGTAGAFTGSLVRRTNKALSGSISTLTGSLSRLTYKSLSGATGAVTGALSTAIVFTVSLAGTMGSLTGALARSTSKSITGAFSLSGDLFKRIPVNLTGSIDSLAGTLGVAFQFKRAKMKAGTTLRSVMNAGNSVVKTVSSSSIVTKFIGGGRRKT